MGKNRKKTRKKQRDLEKAQARKRLAADFSVNADWRDTLRRVSECRFEIPRETAGWMRAPGIIYIAPDALDDLKSDQSPQQVMNVASMPGIVEYSLAMPDIHYGYGFPIGGVAAFSVEDGVISPGGVGFDINCGVRLLATSIDAADVRKKADMLCAELFGTIPSGVGSRGAIRMGRKGMDAVMRKGARWAVEQGIGREEDLEFCEENGAMECGGDFEWVSHRARERGNDQPGTLGAGNHFIEVQYVEEIYDERAARVFGLDRGLAAVMIHSGSRGFGAQVCQDSIRLMREAAIEHGIEIPDRQLACAPVRSREGRLYYDAMAAAANFAWTNRHCMAHLAREAFQRVFGSSAGRLGMHLVYDVAHNVAKIETHKYRGKEVRLCVHRKGATRAFPPGHPDIPEAYRKVGQPALVPGSMGHASYVLTGTDKSLGETWGSICHGAGRRKSRSAAKSSYTASDVIRELDAQGIVVQARSKKGIVEEAPGAYKDVDDVVETCVRAGLARKVARLKPIAVVKG